MSEEIQGEGKRASQEVVAKCDGATSVPESVSRPVVIYEVGSGMEHK